MENLITQEIKIKDVYPDIKQWAEFLKELECDIVNDELMLVRKGLTPEDIKIEEGERSIISYISTMCSDRDNEVLLPKGAMLKDYKKNPVVLFCHEHRGLPIGKNIWIKTDSKGLIAKTQYAKHQEADNIYNYRKDGFPLAESVGFIPLEYNTKGEDGWDKAIENWISEYEKAYGNKPDDSTVSGLNRIYKKWLLLEYSDVPVPSNPEALQIAISKGIVKDNPIITKPGWDETDTSFRYRVREPGLFQEDTFRTVPIKRDKPRINSIMGRLKGENTMTLQSLIFPKEDDWTLDKAKEWLKDHPDIVKELECWFLKCDSIEILTELIESKRKIESFLGMREIYEINLKSLGKEIEELKEGRVFSEKNRKFISNCITQMNEAIEVLNELLKATEPASQESVIDIEDKKNNDIKIDEIENTIDNDIDLSKDELKNIIKSYYFELINKKKDDEDKKIIEIADTIIKKLKGKVN